MRKTASFWRLCGRPALLMLATSAAACAVATAPAARAPSAPAGFSERQLTAQGRVRTYELFTPTSLAKAAPALVIVLHGGRSRGRGMERLTHFSQVAKREGFVVAYPDGVEGQWNDGRGLNQYTAQRDGVDDVAFISALVDDIARRQPIDRSRIYVTGMSNGGLMAHRIACEAPGLVAAIAPVEGVIPERTAQQCPPGGAPTPMLLIKGADAPVFEQASRRYTAMATAEFWAKRNGCGSDPQVVELVDTDPNDGTRTRRVSFKGCDSGAEVVWLDVVGGGHTWPGGYQYLPQETVGRTSRDFDATEEIWRFFSAHRRGPQRESRG